MLTTNTSIANPTIDEGEEFKLVLQQDSSGGRTVFWDTAFEFDSTPPLSTIANSVNIYSFIAIADSVYCVGYSAFG